VPYSRPFNLTTAVAFLCVALAALITLSGVARAQAGPVGTDPGEYGTIKMDRRASAAGMNPVLFPHWVHRVKYACKVCHTDIGFPMKADALDIKMPEIMAGEHCGECHNGKTAFFPTDCKRCHSYGLDDSERKAKSITTELNNLPRDEYGNMVNWVAAMRRGKIRPAAKIDGSGKLTPLDMDVIIPVTKFKPHPPDVKFPHKAHTERLDCSSCHTKIFKQKKGGNPEMSMIKIISGKYCGVCHGRVAFPLNDCFRCHSQPISMEKSKQQKERAEKAIEEKKKRKEMKEEWQRKKREWERKQRRRKTLF